MKHSILCVDDEVDNVDALERLLRKKYAVLKATSGEEALELLKTHSPTVIISDQRMPKMMGVEFLSRSLKTHPDAVRILLTGYADIEVVIEAINNGQVYRYLTKPWDPVDLVNGIDKAVERYELHEALGETNRKLSQALTELQTLDQAKNQFMVLVNHELKTPLTTILSFTDLLAESKLDSDQIKYLDRVRKAASRLQEMINDSLELVSAETQQTKLNIVTHPVARWAGAPGLSPSIEGLIKEKDLRITRALADGAVSGDAALLLNVFHRLLHNAAKFADPGTEISVKGRVDGNDYIFTIEDTGKPLDEQKTAHLLKPFTLNENTLNHSVGTGLGLSICNALLKLHGSHLELSGSGNKVTALFRLPQSALPTH